MDDQLDSEEHDVEIHFDDQQSISTPAYLATFQEAAHRHITAKKSITIRVALHDIEAIRLKASKVGMGYQTYINMLIHQDATRP